MPTDVQTALQMLSSISSLAQRQACDDLALSGQATPSVMAALEKATHNRDRDVAAAARKAIDMLAGAAAKHIRANNKIAICVKGFPRSHGRVPPTRFGIIGRIFSRHMCISGKGMAD